MQTIRNRAIKFTQEKLNLRQVHKVPTFLWPQYKQLRMLSDSEKQDVHSYVKYALKAIANENVCSEDENEDARNSSSDDESPSPKKRAKYDKWVDVYDCSDNHNVKKEFNPYLKLWISSTCDDVLLWKENQNLFPRLSILARRILSVTASSCPSERSFQFSRICS